MTDLQDLAQRVEMGAGDNWDLHEDVLTALIGVNAPDAKRWYGAGQSPIDSLDECVALLERVLPGWCPSVAQSHPYFLVPDEPSWEASVMGNVREVLPSGGDPADLAYDTSSGRASSPARALLAAALRALSPKEPRHEG